MGGPPSTELKSRTIRLDAAPRLQVLSGARKGEFIALAVGETVLGRGTEADLVFEDTGVSRRHVRLTVGEDFTVLAEDLGSSNGLFVNRRRVEAAPLQLGDAIEVGPDVALRLTAPATDAPDPEPPPMTGRELEVARLVAAGLSNVAIGRKMSISPRTVARHLANIFERLDFDSRTQLARYMLDKKLA